MRYDIERFLLAVMPMLIAAFCIMAISVLCTDVWLLVALEIPVWAAVLWWMWIESRERHS